MRSRVGSYVVDGDVVVRRQVAAAFDRQEEEKLSFRLVLGGQLLRTDLLDLREALWVLASVHVAAFHLDYGY